MVEGAGPGLGLQKCVVGDVERDQAGADANETGHDPSLVRSAAANIRDRP
jgi:hypothetical protein